MNIQALISAYKKRSDNLRKQTDAVFKGNKTEKIIIPNYQAEVVIPLLRLLALELPEEKVIVPDNDNYGLNGGYFRITVNKAVLGGLSFPTKEDHNIYYTPLFHLQPTADRIKINSIKQLANIIREQIKNR